MVSSPERLTDERRHTRHTRDDSFGGDDVLVVFKSALTFYSLRAKSPKEVVGKSGQRLSAVTSSVLNGEPFSRKQPKPRLVVLFFLFS